jgi:ABC-type transporter Mla MlaB component
MIPEATALPFGQEAPLRMRLPRDAGYPDLVVLLRDLTANGRYQISLDVSAVSHLGTMEFRLLGVYADRCQEHGGFLKLDNASAKLAALVRSYGCHHLLAGGVEQASPARDGIRPAGSVGAAGSLSG